MTQNANHTILRVERFPRDLHRHLKSRAAQEGITLRSYVIQKLEGHLTYRKDAK